MRDVTLERLDQDHRRNDRRPRSRAFESACGSYMMATMGSETTADAFSEQGVVRPGRPGTATWDR